MLSFPVAVALFLLGIGLFGSIWCTGFVLLRKLEILG